MSKITQMSKIRQNPNLESELNAVSGALCVRKLIHSIPSDIMKLLDNIGIYVNDGTSRCYGGSIIDAIHYIEKFAISKSLDVDSSLSFSEYRKEMDVICEEMINAYAKYIFDSLMPILTNQIYYFSILENNKCAQQKFREVMNDGNDMPYETDRDRYVYMENFLYPDAPWVERMIWGFPEIGGEDN